MAATITNRILYKNECPVEGHPFLPNKKDGILLSHPEDCQEKQQTMEEEVNLSRMDKEEGVNLFS